MVAAMLAAGAGLLWILVAVLLVIAIVWLLRR